MSPTPLRPRGALRALVALALMSPVAAPSLAFAQAPASVERICADVLRLSPGEAHFAACVASLGHSQRELLRGRALAGARRNCRAEGLQPGSARLAECELASASVAGGAGPPGDTPNPGGDRSYFTTPRQVIYQRDDLACARLGFDPSQTAFSDCTADLRAALAGANNPMM